MLKPRVLTILLLSLALPLMLGQCNNSVSQPPLNQSEAIKLAKGAAAQLQSPPRIYALSTSYVEQWPDASNSVVASYNSCGVAGPAEACMHPITLTTALTDTNSNNNGQDVTFLANWQGSGAKQSEHSWRFHIDSTNQVTFLSEQGDPLPPRVQ